MNTTELIIESRSQLGLRLRSHRRAQKLTQEQLARIVGIDRTIISRIEQGRTNVTLDTITLIAGGLGVGLSELFDGIGFVPDPKSRSQPWV